MEIPISQYVPLLKWRQGEYQALYRLNDKVKESITPIIIVPPIEYDFEEKRMKKTVQDHIEPFPNRYFQKWGDRSSLVDLHDSLESEVMDSGEEVVNHIFTELRGKGCYVVPVVGLAKASRYLHSVKSIIAVDGRGVGLRLKLEELMSLNVNTDIDNLLELLAIGVDQVDLIIDLGEPESYEPYTAFSKALSHSFVSLKRLEEYRSFILLGTSLKLRTVGKPGGERTRHEWILYKELVNSLKGKSRVPAYGDYAIDPPDFINLDMRRIKPAGKIVYTAEDIWYVTKGGAFRGNEIQMRGQCQNIIASGYYMGDQYSQGDKRIKETAIGKANTGNLSTWKQVGMSHHLTMVAHQLASFHAP